MIRFLPTTSPFQVVDPSFSRESQYLAIWHHLVENTEIYNFHEHAYPRCKPSVKSFSMMKSNSLNHTLRLNLGTKSISTTCKLRKEKKKHMLLFQLEVKV